MKRTLSTLLLLGVISAAGLSQQAASQTASPQSKQTALEKLLKESGVDFQPFQGEKTFISVYEGKLNKEISVIIIDADSAVVIFSDAAAGKEVDLTPPVFRELLEYNLKTDYIKVGISDINSIRVQTEQSFEGLKAAGLKLMIDQVAAGSDEVAKILQPARKKAAPKK